MYIAYSALRKNHNSKQHNTELRQRLDAYEATCHKYREEIAAIQKYLPGWTPAFERRG